VTADAPLFVSLAEAVDFHDDLIARYGGMPGIRDRNLLASSVAAPQAAVADGFLHQFPWGMAAAYLFHIIRNHAFVDGNKRTALGCALFFLENNGHPIRIATARGFELARRIAQKEAGEVEIADALRRHAIARRGGGMKN
jgi:death-on-curing protein